MTPLQLVQKTRLFVATGKMDESLLLLDMQLMNIDKSLLKELTMVRSRFEAVKTDYLIKGILERSEYDVQMRQIEYAVLELIGKIEQILPTATSRKEGRLFHSIPTKMSIVEETKCIIRIAHNDDILLQKLAIDKDINVDDVSIAEVMGVELVDFNETATFKIRTITEHDQFVDESNFTHGFSWYDL